MKRLLIFLVPILLAACIEIDDLGPFGAKASLDPQSKGHWVLVSSNDAKLQKNISYDVIEIEGAYEAQAYLGGQKQGPAAYPVKTLTIGNYHFFALHTGENKWALIRYQIEGDELKTYRDVLGSAGSFADKNFPESKEFKHNEPFLDIKAINDEAIKIISAIPDNETYWQLTGEFKKTEQ